MRRLTIKGYLASAFLMRAAAADMESLLKETEDALREGAERIGLKADDFTELEISNKDYNEATSISGISPVCRLTYIFDSPDGFQYRIRIGWAEKDGDLVPVVSYIQKVKSEGEYDHDYILSPTYDSAAENEVRWTWVGEGKRKKRVVNNIPNGWIGVEEYLPEPGKINENTCDYQKYMCLVKVSAEKSADARPLAFTEDRKWVNGNVDMTKYVIAWQDNPPCINEANIL